MKKQVFNPYLPSFEYVPDGEPRIFEGRLYIFGSHDRFGGESFCMNDYVCWSAPEDDLSDWRYEGVIYRKNQDPHNADGSRRLYAPDVVRGLDGKYYMYYALDDLGIMSVAVADGPAGRYEYFGDVKMPDGHVVGSSSGDMYQFDPGVLVDDDGRIWLYSGFGLCEGAEDWYEGRRPWGMYVMELDTDMLTVIQGPELVLKGNIAEKESHAFFEASSMRRINGKYYLIYSSVRSHELYYMVSDRPDGGFKDGGTLISLGDVGLNGRIAGHTLDHSGNTHGSIICVDGQWYVFYHRQTNRTQYSRQACAEKIYFNSDGSIDQTERTSCGLNKGPLRGEGTYPAYIACNLFSIGHEGYEDMHADESSPFTYGLDYDSRPYLTQDGEDREEGEDQYITAWRDGGVIGFKYFEFKSSPEISVKVRGEAKGVIEICTGLDDTDTPVDTAARIPVDPDFEGHDLRASLNISEGVQPLYFVFRGKGSLDLISFKLQV